MRINIIKKAIAVVAAACTFIVSSCETPEVRTSEVSVKTPVVDCNYGSLFVSVKCEGDWKLYLDYPGADQDWASISLTQGSGDRNDIILSYRENESDKDRNVIIYLESASGNSECSVRQTAYAETVKPGPGPDTPTPEEPKVDVLKADWLELPAMDSDSGLEYYSHSFNMNGNRYRNYSFGWSQKDLVSIWVAYPLCTFYTKRIVSRTNDWNYDPLLGMAKSPAPFGGYGEELERGHQVPSADRLCCYEANAQTFYGTNITPQKNEHNSPFWSNLEDKVRTWANTSDTTYVITGCVVEGSTRITHDGPRKVNEKYEREPMKMTVPVAYWKALLRFHKSSTKSQWACAAFYTEHKAYGDVKDFKSFAMSIDELEEKIGIDLFVNLPAKLGETKAAELEAQNPKNSNIWW